LALIDLQKAYDTIEFWALRAAMLRIGLPAPFIELVMNMHSGFMVQVRTAYGLTGAFEQRRGVLQGDPLACLLFLIYMDPLICAIHRVPQSAYVLRDAAPQPFVHTTRILPASLRCLFFADDGTLISDSFDGLQRLVHEVHRFSQFFGAVVNTDKTVIASVNGNHGQHQQIHYDGQPLAMLPPHEAFCVLGVHFTCTLDWSRQRAVLKGIINRWLCSLCRLHLTVAQARYMANTVIVPALLYRLAIGCCGLTEVAELQSMLERLVLRTARLPSSTARPIRILEPTHMGVGIADILQRLDEKLIRDTLVRLSDQCTSMGVSTRARLAALQHKLMCPFNPLAAPQLRQHCNQSPSVRQTKWLLTIVMDACIRLCVSIQIPAWPVSECGNRAARPSDLPIYAFADLPEMQSAQRVATLRKLHNRRIYYTSQLRSLDARSWLDLQQTQLVGSARQPEHLRRFAIQRADETWYHVLCQHIDDTLPIREPATRQLMSTLLYNASNTVSHTTCLRTTVCVCVDAQSTTGGEQRLGGDLPTGSERERNAWAALLSAEHMILVSTDGSCIQHGVNHALAAGYGWCIETPQVHMQGFGRTPGIQDSYRSELLAVADVLRRAPSQLSLRLQLDNKAAISSVVRIFESVSTHIDHNILPPVRELLGHSQCILLSELYVIATQRVRAGSLTVFEWVKGHSGNRGNESADALAKRGTLEAWYQTPPPQSLHYLSAYLTTHDLQLLEHTFRDFARNQRQSHSYADAASLPTQGRAYKMAMSLKHRIDADAPSPDLIPIDEGQAEGVQVSLPSIWSAHEPKPVAAPMQHTAVLAAVPKAIVRALERDRKRYAFAFQLAHGLLPTLSYLHRVDPVHTPSDQCPHGCLDRETTQHVMEVCTAYEHIRQAMRAELSAILTRYPGIIMGLQHDDALEAITNPLTGLLPVSYTTHTLLSRNQRVQRKKLSAARAKIHQILVDGAQQIWGESRLGAQ
jgi:ribonuclease HI